MSRVGVSDKYMNVYPRSVPNPGPHQTSDGSLAFSTEQKTHSAGQRLFQAHYDFAQAAKTYDFDVYVNDPQVRRSPC